MRAVGRQQSTEMPDVQGQLEEVLAEDDVQEVVDDDVDDDDYYEEVGEEEKKEVESISRNRMKQRQNGGQPIAPAGKSAIATGSGPDESLDALGKRDDLLAARHPSNASNGSAMDFSLAMGLTLGSGILKLSEDADLMPYYHSRTGKRSRSRSLSNSGRKTPSDLRTFTEGNGEIGAPYYTREPQAALNRLSGGLKYNGRWSGNMSDILGSGLEGSGSGSALLSLMIPELGGRGSYGNSVSPLGITLATPCASPQTAIAYTHRGFQSPRDSFSMAADKPG